MILFRYISGNNHISTKLAMTAPVITGMTIPMTAPVISGFDTTSFVMPDELPVQHSLNRLTPQSPSGKCRPGLLLLSGFLDRLMNKTSYKRTGFLESTLKKEGITMIGTPFLMRYNSPWAPDFLRRNEVSVEIWPG